MSAFFNIKAMLDDLKKLIDDIGQFDLKQEIIKIVGENTELLAELQTMQWDEGRGVDGEFIRPFYSENPYFRTPDAAKKYATWKQKAFPNPQRPYDVPNLYINGYLWKSLYAEVKGEEFEIESAAPFADDVFATHKNARGLNPDSMAKFSERVILPNLKEVFKTKIGIEI